MVSLNTVRLAYRQLNQEGYVSLSKSLGTKVIIKYDEQEIERNIQTFFAARKDALLDLSCSMKLFFSNKIQLASWKRTSEEKLVEMERLVNQDIAPSYRIIKHFQQIYGSLNNDLLMLLIWKICMFYLAPFLSSGEYIKFLDTKIDYLSLKISLCRKNDWAALRCAANDFQNQMDSALRRFYETRITMPSPAQQTVFTWSSYKKVSQICYSLGLKIMSAISRGTYPPGSFYPHWKNLQKKTKFPSVLSAAR